MGIGLKTEMIRVHKAEALDRRKKKEKLHDGQRDKNGSWGGIKLRATKFGGTHSTMRELPSQSLDPTSAV